MDIFATTMFRDLEKLNYTVNESKVYLKLLEVGPSLAGNIAKETKLDRSSTYNALASLRDRGVVSTVHENKRTIYVPEHPKKILDYYKEKEEIAKKLLPGLTEQYNYRKPKSAVKLFTGFKGLKSIFADILDSCKAGEQYYVLGAEGQFGKEMPYYKPLFRKLKAQKKIKTKLISRKEKKDTKYTKYARIPSNLASPSTINIYGSKVAIFIWEENPRAVLIENQDVADTFRSYYDFMWKHARK